MKIISPEGATAVDIIFRDMDGATISTFVFDPIPDSVVLQPHPPKPNSSGVVADSFGTMPPPIPKPDKES